MSDELLCKRSRGDLSEEEDGRTRRRSVSEWWRLFEAQALSGMSVPNFCSAEGLHPSIFYRARKRMGWSPNNPFTFPRSSSRPSVPVDAAVSSDLCGSPFSSFQEPAPCADRACQARVSSRPEQPVSQTTLKDSSQRGEFFELRVGSPPESHAGVPPTRSDAGGFSGIEIALGDGLRIFLSCGFDKSTLSRVIETLAPIKDRTNPRVDSIAATAPHDTTVFTSCHHGASKGSSPC